MLYGVKEGGFVMLTGEVGTGKTTIIRCLLEQLPENTEIAIILNPMANIKELLCTICDEFEIAYPSRDTSIKAITDLLHKYLLSNHRQGKNTVLLIDEAQLLSAEVLEQVRLLTNLETATKKLLQIVLVGQPELNELLSQPRLRQLSQRITARFHLTPLTLEETQSYISHRLSVAGMPEGRNPFSPRIIKQIHRFTGGVPRIINILCERTLIGTYGHNKSEVDAKVFQLAKKEVEGNIRSNAARKIRQPLVTYSVLSACGIIGLAIIFFSIRLMFGDTEPVDTIADTAKPQEIVRQTNDKNEDDASKEISNADKQGKSAESSFEIEDNVQAQAILFEYLKFDINPETHPCWQINTQGQYCGKAKFNTWEEIGSINRPMVLSLINENKFKSYAVLIGLQERFALLIDRENNRNIVDLEKLGPLWTGEVFYAWKKPESYSEPLSIGDSNSTVSAVAAQFALLDSQPKPLASKRFNRALQTRIKIFQREHNLADDGILGERTLMKLNETLGLSTTLNREFL